MLALQLRLEYSSNIHALFFYVSLWSFSTICYVITMYMLHNSSSIHYQSHIWHQGNRLSIGHLGQEAIMKVKRLSWRSRGYHESYCILLNTLRPRQNGHHFADDTFKRIFVNANVRILIEISLKFVPKCPINNIPSLVQIMAWRRPGDKSLSEPMMVCLPTHISVTRPQWVNISLKLVHKGPVGDISSLV